MSVLAARAVASVPPSVVPRASVRGNVTLERATLFGGHADTKVETTLHDVPYKVEFLAPSRSKRFF